MQPSRHLNVRVIVLICLASLVVFFAFVSGGALFTFRDFYKVKTKLTVAQEIYRETQARPNAPLLGPLGSAKLEEARKEETAWLNSYGWIDRAKGTIHIPIARAMEIVREEI